MPKIPIQLPSGRVVILDPQRPGDHRLLARLLAEIAWRLAKEPSVETEPQNDKPMIDSDNLDEQAV